AGCSSFQLRALEECISDNQNTNVILLYFYILTARKLKEILTSAKVIKEHLKEDMYQWWDSIFLRAWLGGHGRGRILQNPHSLTTPLTCFPVPFSCGGQQKKTQSISWDSGGRE
uniref:Uncharacterized protein n=1 Tax=Naja naja TaxID=35670 RepID=A0A8C7E5E2_NAJNA